jgi:hypothetical protein
MNTWHAAPPILLRIAAAYLLWLMGRRFHPAGPCCIHGVNARLEALVSISNKRANQIHRENPME